MVGRGAYGRPWLPGHMAVHAATGAIPPAPSGRRLFDLVARHYEAIIDHYGPLVGVKAARKHLGWYMDRSESPTAAALRRAVLTETRPRSVLGLLASALAGSQLRSAA